MGATAQPKVETRKEAAELAKRASVRLPATARALWEIPWSVLARKGARHEVEAPTLPGSGRGTPGHRSEQTLGGTCLFSSGASGCACKPVRADAAFASHCGGALTAGTGRRLSGRRGRPRPATGRAWAALRQGPRLRGVRPRGGAGPGSVGTRVSRPRRGRCPAARPRTPAGSDSDWRLRHSEAHLGMMSRAAVFCL